MSISTHLGYNSLLSYISGGGGGGGGGGGRVVFVRHYPISKVNIFYECSSKLVSLQLSAWFVNTTYSIDVILNTT